jgi:hypothetical protein
MTLFHFTNRVNIELILNSMLLKAYKRVFNSSISNKAICFTSQLIPSGHGLMDGRKITKDQAKNIPVFTIHNGFRHCLDHTEFCLKIEIPLSDKLVHAHDVHSTRDLNWLNMTGYTPCSESRTDLETFVTLNALNLQIIKEMSPTWWYFFGDLNLNQVNFQVLHKEDNQSFSLLNKDAHGHFDFSGIPAKKIYTDPHQSL